jgi:prepilin-type N-terminal cleavage/methylation domain-containing protein
MPSLYCFFRKVRGFTLTELMIVVVIVGILAILAVNQFSGGQDQALQREAVTNLKLIAAAEKIYRMEMGGYVNSSDAGHLNENLSLMLPTSSPKWTYNVTNASATTFMSRANRTSGTSTTYCINQSLDDPVQGNCP